MEQVIVDLSKTHEGEGIVDCVSPGVNTVRVGDNINALYITEYGKWKSCKPGKTNHLYGFIKSQLEVKVSFLMVQLDYVT